MHLLGHLLVSLLFFLLGSLLSDGLNALLQEEIGSVNPRPLLVVSTYLTQLFLLVLHLLLFRFHLRHLGALLLTFLVRRQTCRRPERLLGRMPLLSCA